jgi:hypothetical protein
MKKLLFGIVIGFVVAVLLSAGTVLLAQELRAATPPAGKLVVLGGLKMREGANIEEAERLFKEQLIPEMQKIDGLEMKILKRLQMPEAQAPTPTSCYYDYIMMAEVEGLQVFMQLSQSRGAGLEAFGDMMKKHAGSPSIDIYSILAKTEEKE